MHPKFDPTGIQTHDHDNTFHVTKTPARTTQPSVICAALAHHCPISKSEHAACAHKTLAVLTKQLKRTWKRFVHWDFYFMAGIYFNMEILKLTDEGKARNKYACSSVCNYKHVISLLYLH